MNRSIARHLELSYVLTDILAVLNSNRPLGATLDFVVTRAARALGADAAIISRILPASRSAVLEASFGLPPELITPTVPFVRGKTYSVDRAIDNHELFAVPDFRAHVERALAEGTVDPAPGEEIWTTLPQTLYSSALVVPLATRVGTLGGLTLYFESPREFSPSELRIAMALGDQVALAVENARLRAAAAEQAVANERNRLARELHDAVTQTLFSASLIADVLPRLWQRDPASVPAHLEQLRRLTRGALAEMRTLLVELRPAALVEAPLGDLLRQLVDATVGQSSIPVTLAVDGQRTLPPDVQIAIYRIAQESLNNVAKHSEARSAEVTLRITSDAVDLRVRDDGRGFDQATVPADHLGLSIMRERAHAVGATVDIASRPGEGTEIRATWRAGGSAC